jgi:hypothetical protein
MRCKSTVAYAMLLLLYPAITIAQSVQLTGEMSSLNYLVGGKWTCTSTVLVNPTATPKVSTMFEAYDAVGDSVLHVRTSSTAIGSSDDYYGYDRATQLYWHTGIDFVGRTVNASSSDAAKFHGFVFSKFLDARVPITSSITKVSDDEYTRHVILGSNGTNTVDADCHRQPSPP